MWWLHHEKMNSNYYSQYCLHFAQEILISCVASKVVVVLVFSTLESCFELSNDDASYSIYIQKSKSTLLS